MANWFQYTDTVIVVNQAAVGDLVVAMRMPGTHVVLDPGAGLDPMVSDWIDRSSGQIDQAVVVDSGGAFPPSLDTTLGGLIGGPLGFAPNALTPRP